MTGVELAAELEVLLLANPHISKWRTGKLLFNSRQGIKVLKRSRTVQQATIIKVREFIANPPDDVFKRPCGGNNGRVATTDAKERRKAGIRKSISRKAIALLAGDQSVLTTGGKVSHAVAAAMVAIQNTQETERRAADPVEQALLKLRRSRRIVYRASVHGGPDDRFYVSGKGKETVDVPELLKMAEAA
jgi:hypothetical protein